MAEEITRTVRAGRRTYFFDVKETTVGDPYLVITESAMIGKDQDEKIQHRRAHIMVFDEGIEEFVKALNEVAPNVTPKK